MKEHRIEKDALGEIKVPHKKLWGASTQRAIENFPISFRSMPPAFIEALALVKWAAAKANGSLGLIDKNRSSRIQAAALNIAEGELFEEFPLDVFQTGSATSTNMNMNEVIATLAKVHPNDHVNLSQSSNDVIPTALNLTAAVEIKERLLPSLKLLRTELSKKAKEFARIVKIGRTHLMDAMPVTLGKEFGGWAMQIEKGIKRIERTLPSLCELAIGGTAVGTGFGAHPKFASQVCAMLSKRTGLKLRSAEDHFEALSSRSGIVETSGALKALATSFIRIADDIKFIASGPRLGLAEISLPAVAPGSSMMPGKVNPVMCEMLSQVGMQVIANDVAVTMAACGGHLELNTGLPLIISNLIESIEIMSSSALVFAEKCVKGIKANKDVCERNVGSSLALATALVSKVGYAKAAEIAKEAAQKGLTVREVALKHNIADADVILDEAMESICRNSDRIS